MSTTLQGMQPQQSSVHLQQKNKVELNNFLQTIADGFLVLIEENKQRGEQIEALSREIARLTHGGLQTPLTLATETSCRSGHGNDAICRRLEKINLEINALRAEIERQPVVKNQSGEKRRQAPEGCSQPQDQEFSRPDGRPSGENPRPAQPRKVQREAEEPAAADSVYTFANVFYRANNLLGNSDGKRLVFSGNLEHVPLLPILAIIYFQQNLLPAFERVAMLLG
jgi:cell division septum initiation protein DivIVA